MSLAPHDRYFTIGETVGQPGSPFPDLGLEWHYLPPCVSLEAWPRIAADPEAPLTTVSHWDAWEYMEDQDGVYLNDKRAGFGPFLDLPRYTPQPLELALCIGDDEERGNLTAKGWRVRDAYAVAATPWDYQQYIQQSAGEFSCAKPSCVRMQNAWISDRTLCYLASGRPAVVQFTGPSRFLPDAGGLFRFRTLDEAVRAIETIRDDYATQSSLARALSEEYFDARRVCGALLERALA
jgi:hypothetical protein